MIELHSLYAVGARYKSPSRFQETRQVSSPVEKITPLILAGRYVQKPDVYMKLPIIETDGVKLLTHGARVHSFISEDTWNHKYQRALGRERSPLFP